MKLKFRYDPFIDDTIENGNVVGIESMSVTYTQPADTDSDRDEVQFLTVQSMTVPGDDEPYYRISMPEGGIWSIEDSEDLTQIIEDFKSRLGLKKKEVEVKEEKKEVTIEEIMNDSFSALHQEVVALLKKNCNLISRPKHSELLSDLFINEEEWKNTIGQLEKKYNIDLTDINSNIIVGELVQKIYLKRLAKKNTEDTLNNIKPEIKLEDITKPNEYDRVAKKVFEIINESCNIPDGQLQMDDIITDIFTNQDELEKTIKKIGDKLHVDLIDIPHIVTIGNLVYEAYIKYKIDNMMQETKFQNYQNHLAEEREDIFNEIRGCLETWHHIYKCENEMYRIPAYKDQEIINDLIAWLNDKDLIKDYQVDNARVKLTALKASDPSHFTVKKIIDLVRAFQEEDAAY